MHHQKKPIGIGAMLLILLAAGPPFLAAQTQPVTRTIFESSTREGYTAVTPATSGRVWGGPAKYTNDADTGAVAYMLLGTLKGCEFANAETDRGSKVCVSGLTISKYGRRLRWDGGSTAGAGFSQTLPQTQEQGPSSRGSPVSIRERSIRCDTATGTRLAPKQAHNQMANGRFPAIKLEA